MNVRPERPNIHLHFQTWTRHTADANYKTSGPTVNHCGRQRFNCSVCLQSGTYILASSTFHTVTLTNEQHIDAWQWSPRRSAWVQQIQCLCGRSSWRSQSVRSEVTAAHRPWRHDGCWGQGSPRHQHEATSLYTWHNNPTTEPMQMSITVNVSIHIANHPWPLPLIFLHVLVMA